MNFSWDLPKDSLVIFFPDTISIYFSTIFTLLCAAGYCTFFGKLLLLFAFKSLIDFIMEQFECKIRLNWRRNVYRKVCKKTKINSIYCIIYISDFKTRLVWVELIFNRQFSGTNLLRKMRKLRELAVELEESVYILYIAIGIFQFLSIAFLRLQVDEQLQVSLFRCCSNRQA